MPSPPRPTPATVDMPSASVAACLVVLEGPGAGSRLRLDREITVLGRGDDADSSWPEPGLSRRHAELRHSADGFSLRDLGSSNGTFVNGTRIEHTQLQPGDKIRLGPRLVLELCLYDGIEDELVTRQRFEALGRLTAGIAHDFNNMLSAILSNLAYLATLPRAQQLGDAAEPLADIEQAAERAAALSRKLLGFARGTGRPGSRIDVGAVIGEVAQLAARTFGRGIAIEVRSEDKLYALGGGLELHQALMNLCLNARDAMPKGGTLSLAARSVQDGEMIEIQVRDTGTGMDATTAARVFDPFFTTKRDGAGFGLGLSTVRDVVTQLGGRIHVESSPEAGTCFTLQLVATDRHNARTTQPRLRGPVQAPLDSLTILLVDDEDMVRRSARRLLCRAGHEVLEASSGAEGLALYRDAEHRPDVVMLDIDMPAMNGEEVLVEMLTLDPTASVVMVTGHVDHDVERRLRLRGAQAVVHKPWTVFELLDAVAAAAAAGPAADDARETYVGEP